jgi:hypothetical protein
MKKDTLTKLIAFFKANDKELLNNPAVLKEKLVNTYGTEYQPEITVFCEICSIVSTKNIIDLDKEYIVYLGKNINRDYKINEKVAVMLLGCYAYIKQFISFDILKELTLYKPNENEQNNLQQHSNTNQSVFNSHSEAQGGNKQTEGSASNITKNPEALYWIGLICGISSALIAFYLVGFPRIVCAILSIIAIILGRRIKELDKQYGKKSKFVFCLGLITLVVMLTSETISRIDDWRPGLFSELLDFFR